MVKMRDYRLKKGILLLCFHKIQVGPCFQKLGLVFKKCFQDQILKNIINSFLIFTILHPLK